ncbi:MAG: VWA domain-containing protein [Myxococcota bacterium]
MKLLRLSMMVGIALWAGGCGGGGSESSLEAAGSEGEGEDPGVEGEAEAEAEAEAEGEGEAEAESEGGSSVGFAGAQDFGLFRAIVEDGGIPAPSTLDSAGFFAEHWLEMPPPECGGNLCLHGMLGVAANMMNGANCTLLRLGLNTPIETADIPETPKNLVVVLDRSGSMNDAGKIEYAREGLKLLVDALDPDDRLGLVLYSTGAELVRAIEPVDDPEAVKALIDGILASGTTNVYDGLDLGFQTLADVADLEHQNRVIFVSDGLPTAGETSTEAILEMAFDWAAEGLALTTVGVGTDFGIDLMRSLAEYGSGNFYFVDDAPALEEVFVDELDYFTQAIATDVSIFVENGESYFAAETFGTHLWEPYGDGGVKIRLPSLFIARRESDDSGATGRRGGGGTLLVEMLPLAGEAEDPGSVAAVSMDFRYAGEEALQTQELEVRYEQPPGTSLPDGAWTEIAESSLDMRKAFVMLNIFAALRRASEAAAWGGDVTTAYGILQQIEPGVDDWLDAYPDDDIDADHELILKLMINLLEAGAGDPGPVEEDPWEED